MYTCKLTNISYHRTILTLIPYTDIVTDLFTFPRVDISNISHPQLSSKDVLDAEQLILMVLRLTVPVCYFAQFARPLWDRMKSADTVQREHCLLKPTREKTADEANSINSKSVSR